MSVEHKIRVFENKVFIKIIYDAFLKTFFEVGIHSFQHSSVDLGDFHANSFLQAFQCTGPMLVYTCFEVTPQEIIALGQVRGAKRQMNVPKFGNKATGEERAKNCH